MITQCIHHTCWRLAWGKQLLIASNPLQFVWDHLSSLLCFSVVTLWKFIGWQLMYGFLQSPQPGPRDPATLFSLGLLSISSSFSFSFALSSHFSASQSIFFRSRCSSLHLPVVLCQLSKSRQETVCTWLCLWWRGSNWSFGYCNCDVKHLYCFILYFVANTFDCGNLMILHRWLFQYYILYCVLPEIFNSLPVTCTIEHSKEESVLFIISEIKDKSMYSIKFMMIFCSKKLKVHLSIEP